MHVCMQTSLNVSVTRVMCDIVAAERAKVLELDALIIVTQNAKMG